MCQSRALPNNRHWKERERPPRKPEITWPEVRSDGARVIYNKRSTVYYHLYLSPSNIHCLFSLLEEKGSELIFRIVGVPANGREQNVKEVVGFRKSWGDANNQCFRQDYLCRQQEKAEVRLEKLRVGFHRTFTKLVVI